MKRALCIALLSLFAAVGASATTYVARQGDDSVHITEGACPAQVREKISVLLPPDARFAYAVIGGKSYTACWVEGPNDAVIFYDDDDRGVVPYSAFKEEPGV